MAEHQVDLVLMDLGLPDGSGLELLRSVRKTYPQIPVIIVSANDSTRNIVDATKAGAYYFISKPYVPMRLLEHVEKALDFRSARKQST